jgi:hypothetical protein
MQTNPVTKFRLRFNRIEWVATYIEEYLDGQRRELSCHAASPILALEKLALDLNKDQIIELCVDGNSWRATWGDHIDTQASPTGFGDSPFEALHQLYRETMRAV